MTTTARPGPGTSDPAVLSTVDHLSTAFRRRDVAGALACFMPDDEVSYHGSEAGEPATGQPGLAARFGALFTRDEAYSWTVGHAHVRVRGDLAYLAADATGYAHRDDGSTEDFGYRISGLLERHGADWLWRDCHGCEPYRPR